MKLSRKIVTGLYRLFYFVSFHKFYICEECKLIHKNTDKKIIINDRLRIYVKNKCANNLNVKAHKIFSDAIKRKL